MYWSEEEVENYIRYPSEGSAEELGSSIYFVAQNELDQNEVMAEIVDDLEENGYDYAPTDHTAHANTTRWKPAKSTLLMKNSTSGTTR